MNCPHCNGSGIGKQRSWERLPNDGKRRGRWRYYDGECNYCKGTGQAANKVNSATVVFMGNTYHADGNLQLQYLNTAGKQATAVVRSFRVTANFMDNKQPYPAHWYPLKDIWFEGTDIKTNADVYYPIWKSINLKKVFELFENNKVERI